MIDTNLARAVVELKADPNIDRVYEGRLTRRLSLNKVYDYGFPNYPFIEMEQGDDVLVSVDHDGTWYVNFMSIYENTYHYRTAVDGPIADNEVVEIPLPLKEL